MSSRFFENRECEYYPCHKGVDECNCLFCYCPFYSWLKCPGENHYIKGRSGNMIKVCTDCSFPHRPENYDKIIAYLKMGEENYKKYAEEQNNLNTAESSEAFVRREIERKDNNVKAVFYGIGVGPGEADLITLKAIKAIKKSDVLILPAKDRESCRAYCIAQKALPFIKDMDCEFIPFPMSMKEAELNDFHKEVSNKVEEYLKAGKNVGFLTIGDVSIYSTFDYIDRIVSRDGYRTEYVCGIPSFSAAAAALKCPLVIGDEEMHIIPGSADVENALKLSGTLVFMKAGKALTELKEILTLEEQAGRAEIFAVSNCGMDNEVITEGAEKITCERGYLTVVIVRRR